jgi:hypothetical protein
MPRKTELLAQELNNARELIDRGDTASASNLCRLIEVDSSINILDKLTEIEKHLAALVGREDRPAVLENPKPDSLFPRVKGS